MLYIYYILHITVEVVDLYKKKFTDSNPPMLAELFCLWFSLNLDMLIPVGNLTLCILPKFLKMFYSADKWLFRRNIFGLNVMYSSVFLFFVHYYCFYFILKLRTPQTQNFEILKYLERFPRYLKKKKEKNFLS